MAEGELGLADSNGLLQATETETGSATKIASEVSAPRAPQSPGSIGVSRATADLPTDIQKTSTIAPEGGTASGSAASTGGSSSKPELLLDTNVVISHGKQYVAAGENVVKSSVTELELRIVVDRGIKLRGMPKAASQIPSVGLPTLDTRINVRGLLKLGREGNVGDGIIGATALERDATLITSDKDLLKAVLGHGGKARKP